MSKLADELEGRVSAALAKGHLAGVGNLFVETLPAILSALRRVEKLDAALEKIAALKTDWGGEWEAIEIAKSIARQALTGEA